MPNKPVTALSALAILVGVALSAQAVPAKHSVTSSSTGNYTRAESCHPKALFSASSDFVAVPYTFGGTLDYRPVWVEVPVQCPIAHKARHPGR
jgi:hypothetical protein